MHGGIHGYTHDAENPRSSYLKSSQQQFWHDALCRTRLVSYRPEPVDRARQGR